MRSRISDVCLQIEGVLELYEERLREFMGGTENYRGAEVGLAFGIGEEGSEKGNGICCVRSLLVEKTRIVYGWVLVSEFWVVLELYFVGSPIHMG